MSEWFCYEVAEHCPAWLRDLNDVLWGWMKSGQAVVGIIPWDDWAGVSDAIAEVLKRRGFGRHWEKVGVADEVQAFMRRSRGQYCETGEREEVDTLQRAISRAAGAVLGFATKPSRKTMVRAYDKTAQQLKEIAACPYEKSPLRLLGAEERRTLWKRLAVLSRPKPDAVVAKPGLVDRL